MIIVRTVRALAFTREECAAMAVAATFALVLIVAGAHNLATTGQIGGGAPAVAPVATVTPAAESTEIPGYVDPTVIGIPADEISEDFRTALIDAGFHGDPTDGSETLYGPQNVAVSLCGGDTDCLIASGELDGPVRDL